MRAAKSNATREPRPRQVLTGGWNYGGSERSAIRLTRSESGVALYRTAYHSTGGDRSIFC